MKKPENDRDYDQHSGRAAVLFVVGVIVIGSSSILPPAFFGEVRSDKSYELVDVNGKTVTINRQTGRYLKVPSRF
ncbi:MAG: hypothetical protein AAF387_03320 [Pseudomonadota bacterium]